MIRRPKPGEDEDDILRMQEEFLREKSKNQNHQPSAQFVNLRRTEPTKRGSTSETGEKKPSKYAQSKGLKGQGEKRARFDQSSSPLGDILEKNIDNPPPNKELDDEDDKVYFPKVIPSVLGDIVEKNVDTLADFDFKPMPAQGFPVPTKWDPSAAPKTASAPSTSSVKNTAESTMEVDEINMNTSTKSSNLPEKSYIVSSKDADDIHNENVKVLSKMSEKEILEEQQKLLSTLDPKLIEYLKAKRNQSSAQGQPDLPSTSQKQESKVMPTMIPNKVERMDESDSDNEVENDALWENDILSHPSVNKWLHFDSLEKDKLEWMKGIKESKKVKPDEPYEARFDFKGYLLPYTMEYTEENKTLFHHGEEPHRPGYTLSELIELSRSAVTQQRVMALNTLAGLLEYYNVGTYKDIIEIPLSKIFFIIRFAMDENKPIILEPALKAMRNLICNRVDEACLDALIGFEEGTQQPSLENDKSEIVELESKESEFNDFHLAEIDIITALVRTDILQRIYYILETIRPSFNCVQYCLQILTRLARDSVQTSDTIIKTEHLMNTITKQFVPATSINFVFEPQIVYNGKPILAALKFLRVLSLQSREIGEALTTKYDILRPISEYISSGVDGTYGLRIQIEAFCILTNLLQYNVGLESATSLFPVIITALYKHIHGTDVFATSSLISATHAAAVTQFINIFLNCHMLLNLTKHKHQIYPLLKEGVQKWVTQLATSDIYTCGHLRLVCSTLDCCKTVMLTENIPMKLLINLLKDLASSKGFKLVLKNLIRSSNLLSGIENKDLHMTKNLKNLGSSTIDRVQKVLPVLSTISPLPFLSSLFKVLSLIEDKSVKNLFIEHLTEYLGSMASKMPSLCDNWFTRIETEFLFYVVKVAIQNDIPEANKDLIYTVASKLCYILRIDKKFELQYLFRNVVFNKHWFTAERLMNLVSLSDSDGFSRSLKSVDDIRICYSKVINLNYVDTGPNIVLIKWQEPILPRDWIYLPILMLYSKSQVVDTAPKVFGENARRAALQAIAQKELIICCSLEWILFNELCFSDLLKDIDVTDRFCRIMCVYLCDSSLFLDARIKVLLRKCTQILFKQKASFNFDKELMGLSNFQDFYTQFLEQFQSVSYGDATFAACVLVPLAQKHNVKWRKLLWSEYAGCLRALDCPEDMLCYEMKDYLYPEETDMSLIKSYFQALSGSLLRPGTIAYRIAQHHVESYKNRSNV
ncbi:RNA polymerase II-associated protein 1 [Ostrinia nubilalis]|uniref:RNA polymerase II-associated protein 1 n=1 Tax=Ostrinia nubilalis TaxID=29057 RepID=UPI003082628C